MRRAFALLLLLAFLPSLVSARGGGHSSSSRSHSNKSTKPSSSKSVHVRGYHRKDGTYVAPHDRSAPGTALYSTPYKRDHMAEGYEPHPTVERDSNGRIKRSRAAKEAFEREHPCPATGKTSGRCPGYVVDHVNPLECGGADDPSNMQWQGTADAKAKDKTERYCRP